MSAPTGSRAESSEADFSVIGLDLSLTSSGISDGILASSVQPGKLRGEERLECILEYVRYFARDATLVVIEGPAYGAGAQSGHDELAGLRWLVRHHLWSTGVPFAMVPPTTLKKFTTGNGRATKQDMEGAVLTRWGAGFSDIKVSHGRYDMVDACALARMGQAFLAGDDVQGVVWPIQPERISI